ncbi:hypothetical protein C4D60_Mb05t17970 [Musa balbisiana]|uniref:Uncharacterized protein n=1 Tax=Musa balbisiana TaxID=52838 RepID=A0A4V4H886_MUSBA|nr:hypothetical protein C4D60_Mb05t17970 [Musa balbisiana]
MLVVVAPTPLDYRLSCTAQPRYPGPAQPLSLLHRLIIVPTSLAAITLDPACLPHLAHLSHLLTYRTCSPATLSSSPWPTTISSSSKKLAAYLSPCNSRLSLSSRDFQLVVFHSKVNEISLLTTNASSTRLLLRCFSKSIVEDSRWQVQAKNMKQGPLPCSNTSANVHKLCGR